MLKDVASLEILQAPGLTFKIPELFASIPRLTGAASTQEMDPVLTQSWSRLYSACRNFSALHKRHVDSICSQTFSSSYSKCDTDRSRPCPLGRQGNCGAHH